jgi:hypothetical protein
VDGIIESLPPSTTIVEPLRYAPPFPTRESMVPATSEYPPARKVGTWLGGNDGAVAAVVFISDGKTIRKMHQRSESRYSAVSALHN